MVIVVAIESAEQRSLVREGLALATAFDEPLHLLSVMEIDTDDSRDIGMTDAASKQRLREIARDRVQEAADGITEDYDVEAVLGENVPSEILGYARDQEASYGVIGGRKRTPTGKAIFGSVTQSVLLNADRPIVTVMGDE